LRLVIVDGFGFIFREVGWLPIATALPRSQGTKAENRYSLISNEK